VILDELERAKKFIYVASYTFNHPIIAERLLETVKRGVEVRLILEGDPIGGFQESENLKALSEQVNIRLMSSEELRDRYRFMHAKYVMIDGESSHNNGKPERKRISNL
jgi:phosphatidylserine/phosphatidylglycerophosphate/cardiolipin synthase-like enzyme